MRKGRSNESQFKTSSSDTYSSLVVDKRSKMEKKRPINQYIASISCNSFEISILDKLNENFLLWILLFQANILLIGSGCGISWISVALPLLQSDKSPLLTGAMDVNEVSWIGSVLAIGCIVGNISFAYSMTIIGSKNAVLSLSIPQMVSLNKFSNNSLCSFVSSIVSYIIILSKASWLFMMFGTCPLHLGISRFLSGIVIGGAQVSSSLYTAEIADSE